MIAVATVWYCLPVKRHDHFIELVCHQKADKQQPDMFVLRGIQQAYDSRASFSSKNTSKIRVPTPSMVLIPTRCMVFMLFIR
jgi:hypothetical protein